ncbi:MAG: SDR family oxidoreductase [Novosphingobium sp.]|nr:SDR family oxidoreductase [Novosphingobium sp.]MCP5403691.1 SDR family oxidoreductase [Novosphingobium sp.]
MSRLSGRTCLITGASSGLGAHFAHLAAREGARLVLGARRVDRLDALVSELTGSGHEALAVEMDVTDEASVIAAYDAAEARFGMVDTIIANAGVSSPGRSTDITADAIRGILETNVLGVLLTAREGARRLMAAGSRETGRGRILLVGSMGAETPVKGETTYCASKAAVASLGRNLALEWVRQGVNVNTIQPGFILTEMAGDWFAGEGGKAQIEGFHRRRLQPIGSLDEPVIFFCSDASAETTGATLTIDDGQSL